MYMRTGLGALNCPGDPGCPGYVAPGSSDYQTSLLQEILTNQGTAVLPAPTSQPAPADMTGGFSITDWLNTHSTMLMIGGGLFVALALIGGGRHR